MPCRLVVVVVVVVVVDSGSKKSMLAVSHVGPVSMDASLAYLAGCASVLSLCCDLIHHHLSRVRLVSSTLVRLDPIPEAPFWSPPSRTAVHLHVLLSSTCGIVYAVYLLVWLSSTCGIIFAVHAFHLRM
jgi:hypothetical protein